MTSFAASIVPQIRVILEGSDLTKVSAKAVRKELVARGHDEATIKEHRASIDERIEVIYERLTSVGDSGTPSSAERPLAAQSSSSLPQPLPTVKQEVKPVISVPEPAPVKAEEMHVETDAEMAARLQREFNTESSGRASRSGGAAPRKKKAVKRKSQPTLGSDGEPVPKKKRAGGGGGAFNKELMLSDALIALVNEPRLSRPQVVKRLWEYIKANQLQDPSDGRYILCDAPMRAVFHTEKLHMFTMNKILADHVRDPDEIANLQSEGDVKPKTEGLSKPEIDHSDDSSDDE